MNIKKQLHTIYIKHDGSFNTLAKKSLAQIILKILYINSGSVSIRQLKSEIRTSTSINYSDDELKLILSQLQREKSIGNRVDKYYLLPKTKDNIAARFSENEKLHENIYNKYFSTCETANKNIIEWFKEATILFFEKFSFEWFSQVTKKGKFTSNAVESLDQAIEETLKTNSSVLECDHDWLKKQYFKFIDSEESDENLLFWNYGISMFASRLLAAKNFKDELTLDMFRNGTLVLDTNVLMILDLEAHELSKSFENLERILKSLNISLSYFHITKEEYRKAMTYRKEETISVFDNFERRVLEYSDCPYIKTALRRQCRNGEDVRVLFDKLADVPEFFHTELPIKEIDYKELVEAIEIGKADENLKQQLNAIHKRRTKREKRENPLTHDSGMIKGTYYLRKENKSWIVTNDGSLKLFAIENIKRDEPEIAIGLDVLLAILAINNSDPRTEASNFAPLFKNLIKLSLIPDAETFEVEDLARMLDANLRLNELDSDLIMNIAHNVKRMRINGETDEEISLFLNRSLTKESLLYDERLKKDMAEIKDIRISKEKLSRERNIAFEELKNRRIGELRDSYDRKLRQNRLLLLLIPLFFGVVSFLVIKYLVNNQTPIIQYLVGCSVELVFGLIPLWPLNKKLIKKHSEYIIGIDKIAENEIAELKRRAENE